MDTLDLEGRRLAIEVMATLVRIKHTMIELILKPAGIPASIYLPLMKQRDETTGHLISKRKVAPLILAAVEKEGSIRAVVRNLVEIAAGWTQFHLAADELVARATVQKAREVLRIIKLMEAREEKQKEHARRAELAQLEQEHAIQREREKQEQARAFYRESELLMMMFDSMVRSDDPQQRGYLLQDLLNRLFHLYQIPVTRSFTRNEGGEQIDGAFRLDGWYYLVECRWRKKPADIRDLDGLVGQVGRSGKQTMGLFLSVNGWSPNVPELLRQNPEKSILLMNGYDLRTVLGSALNLERFLQAMSANLNLKAQPHLGVAAFLASER